MRSVTPLQARLITAMLEYGLLKHKPDDPYTLSSGRGSPFYFDVKSACMHYGCVEVIQCLLLDEVHKIKPGFVGGPANGAYLLVSTICTHARVLGFVYRPDRKTHGLASHIDGHMPEGGSSVVIVDDVLTTGGSIEPIVDLVRNFDWKLEAIVPVIDRSEGNHPFNPALVKPILTMEQIKGAMGL
jgi:orotate phosphoribosyltransferase